MAFVYHCGACPPLLAALLLCSPFTTIAWKRARTVEASVAAGVQASPETRAGRARSCAGCVCVANPWNGVQVCRDKPVLINRC